jgi:sulfur carrier protein ThiS adenylyltransferase
MNEEKYKKVKKLLKHSSVGIAGAGGLGSNAAVSLARAGIGRLVIVDFDYIEESNLNRQYYFIDQIGKLKVKALKENIKKINTETIIDILNQKLEKGSMHLPFKDVNVVIEALDKAEIKTEFIEEIMLNLSNKPIISASGIAGYGNSDRIVTKHLGNLHICYDEYAESSDNSILMAPRVCLMANWEANLALEIILGEDSEHSS